MRLSFVPSLAVGAVKRSLCNMSAAASLDVVVKPKSEHTASVIFLHGLGDSGSGWQPIVDYMTHPHIKFMLPSARHREITMFGGESTPAWMDVYGLDDRARDDEQGLTETMDYIQELVKEENELGIPSSRIVVGGFSQGGAAALTYLLRANEKIGGAIALSTWLPLRDTYPGRMSTSNTSTPLLMAHGEEDVVVKYTWGKLSSEKLKELGLPIDFRAFPNLGHSADMDELQQIQEFLNIVVP